MIHLLLKKEEMGRRVAIMAPRGKGLMQKASINRYGRAKLK